MKLLHLAMGLAISAASFVLPAHADNVCTDFLVNDRLAQAFCKAECSELGLKAFTGVWSNDRYHPQVSACIANGKGRSFCECGAPPVPAAAPATPAVEKPKAAASSALATACSRSIPLDYAAAGICAPVCKKLGGKFFTGNWGPQIGAADPVTQACINSGKGDSYCECGAKPSEKSLELEKACADIPALTQALKDASDKSDKEEVRYKANFKNGSMISSHVNNATYESARILYAKAGAAFSNLKATKNKCSTLDK